MIGSAPSPFPPDIVVYFYPGLSRFLISHWPMTYIWILMASSSSSAWFACRETRPDASVRLFCFPWAGGSHMAYMKWDKSLPECEVHAICMPGRLARYREPVPTDPSAVVRDIVQAMKAEKLLEDKLLAIFGWSYGARIGFDVARALAAEGYKVIHFTNGGCRAIHLEYDRTTHTFDDAQMLAYLRREGGTPERALSNPDIMKDIIDLVRKDYTAFDAYQYVSGPQLACPITTFVATEDAMTENGQGEAWVEHTALGGEFRLHKLDGAHMVIVDKMDEIVKSVAEDIQNAVEVYEFENDM